jgi:DUF4097 and DUF4098 domain-containing protein YvlB
MQVERKRILKMVEEGKISADEALALLNELEKSQQTVEKKQEELINELSTVVNFEEGKKAEESDPFKYQSLRNKVLEFVDSAFKKIKDFDLDFNFGQAIDISHVFQHGDANVQNMDVDIANGSVQFRPWDQNDVRIECNAKIYRAASQEEARVNFIKDVIFNVEMGTLRFATQPKWMKVDAVIFIPKADYENVRVRMFNGPVQCENLKVNKLKIKTANGKVSVAGLTGTKLDAETANGKIKVENSTIHSVDVETLNGAIQLEGDYARVEMQSFNGNIICKLTGISSEEIEAKTVTGSIDLGVPEGNAVFGDLKSNLGSFSVELDGIQIIEEKSEMIQKSLHFKPTVTEKQPLKIDADTKTGSISVKKTFVSTK